MTCSYIQKVTLIKSEDTSSTSITSCHCESKKVMKKSRSLLRSHAACRKFFFVVFIGLVTCVHSMHHSNIESSSNSNNRIKEFLEQSQNDSTIYSIDDDYSSDSDDYGDPNYPEHEIIEKYKQQYSNHSKKIHEKDHHGIHELQVSTASSDTSKCAGSCVDRQAKEKEALNAFKKTLLMKLGLENSPNVTMTRKLPDEMLAAICIKNNLPIDYCIPSVSKYEHLEYQSDDPGSYGSNEQVIEQEEDVQFMSTENRIYAFPKGELHHFTNGLKKG
jgi:hypothetical protein